MKYSKMREQKKRRKKLVKLAICIMAFCGMVVFGGNTAMATETTTADTPLTTEDTTTKETGKIIKKKGKKYYRNPDGSYAKKKFVTINKKTYYFDKNGVMQTGWMKKNGQYYYFDRNNGVQKKNCTIDGIKIKKNGKATKSKYNKKKIEVMIKARSVMTQETKPTDSKKVKLKKVFKWVMKHPYKRYYIYAKVKTQKGMELDYANDIFKKGQGCCVSESCAFAFLAKECGYKNVYLCDDTGHAWVEIGGRVYDPLFAEVKDFDTYYNGTYKNAKLHRVGKKKI